LLSNDAARAHLDAVRVADWEDRVRGRARGVGSNLADIVDSLLPFNPARGRRAARADAKETLAKASSNDRRRLFDAFVPGLGGLVEQTWQDGVGRPYPAGYARRPFRAPSHPEASVNRRWQVVSSLLGSTAGFEPESAAWIARWAPYLGYGAGVGVGPFLASAIDAGGSDANEVFRVLVDSAEGTDEVGGMGRHVVSGLLGASRPDGWELIERVLLAAQRQEGLRQAVLEAADEGHPDAFRRILEVVLEHGLLRFSAAVRAADVWLGTAWDVGNAREVERALRQVVAFLDDESARSDALTGGSAEDGYIALWVGAFRDAPRTLMPAQVMFRSGDPERRMAAIHHAADLQLGDAKLLAAALDDPDMRIAAFAVRRLSRAPQEALERLLGRMPAKTLEVPPLLWPWTAGKLERSDVADMMTRQQPPVALDRLARWVPDMSTWARAGIATRIGTEAQGGGHLRELLLQLVGDPSATVRKAAIEAAATIKIEPREAPGLEALLRRKPGDLRRGVIRLLVNQSDPHALASADRLLATGDAQQRLGGLEGLRHLVANNRSVSEARRRIDGLPDGPTAESATASAQIAAIAGAASEWTLEDCLGLLDPAARTTPTMPTPNNVETTSRAAAALLQSLDAVVEANRNERVTVTTHLGAEAELLLGDVGWQFPTPWRRGNDRPLTLGDVPGADLWEEWASSRAAGTRDADGREFARAALIATRQAGDRYGRNDGLELRHNMVVTSVVGWRVLLDATAADVAFLLSAAEQQALAITGAGAGPSSPPGPVRPRSVRALDLVRLLHAVRPAAFDRAAIGRWWNVERWLDEPTDTGAARGVARILRRRTNTEPAGRRRSRPPSSSLIAAFAAGAASEADVIEHLIGRREVHETKYESGGRTFVSRHVEPYESLRALGGRRLPPTGSAEHDEALRSILDRVRRRVVEAELGRGEAPSAASGAALALEYSGGAEVTVSVLGALGSTPFQRGWSYDGESRQTVFSRLVRTSRPGPDDSFEAFTAATRKLKPERLVGLACFAPQWSAHVEHAIGWASLSSAVWWWHAHTKDDQWTVPSELRDAWSAEVAERTALSSTDLISGAVDVEWFNAIHQALGPDRWAILDKAAAYCSSGGGHARARLFADAMRGAATASAIRTRIESKRHQDSVRALGLVPLSPDPDTRQADLLERYAVVQEFIRTSRKFGSQRQASERRAAEIGLENLARTAGYPDPLRLSWALEASEIAELLDPRNAVVERADTVVQLEVTSLGQPVVTASKSGKALASVPARLGKDPDVKRLKEAATSLRRQASRTRASLEAAMIRGDEIAGAELGALLAHPLLRPHLTGLVMITDEGTLGLPIADGAALTDATARQHALGRDEPVRIAHPVDLLRSGTWSAWQRWTVEHELVQPFKQIYRELYVPTSDEANAVASNRYAGHQVQPGTAIRLLGSRGWIAHPEEGVKKTFHREQLTVALGTLFAFGTPAEVEAPTIEQLHFLDSDTGKPRQISTIPPRLFSEIMRDLDLVVSVAHVGGVDPEASASTVEMRATLISETLAALSIANVRIDEPWAIIDGSISEYSLHLGSGQVHRRPGGAVCIIPIHSQHRGRVFLPFADDDPKTAEVLAKVLLLARDAEIRDPTILEQLRD
jgi:hypothetical protein